jgi:hypothetical protein
MPTDWNAFSFSGPQQAAIPAPQSQWDKFTFTGPSSEEEANRTFTPEEQAMLAAANQSEFGAGTRKRMAEYEGLSPEEASAKYIAGQKEAIRNVYNTVTDPRKLASVAGSAVKAGVNAVAHPIDTAQKIGNYYYENPDSALTDAAFAAFPARKAMGLLGGRDAITTSKGMPRASVRDESELLSTGGARIKEAKKSEAAVPLEDVQAPMQRFRERLSEEALEIDPEYTNKKLANVIKRLDTAYAPPRADPMSRLTKTTPAAKPPMSLKELHAHQRRLDDVVSESKSADGRISTDGFIAIELKKSVGEMIDAHPESSSFKIGKHEYHRGKMSQSMSDLKKRAEGRVQWRNGDEAGALQAEVQNFLRSKKNRYALTPEVRRKLDRLSRDNTGKVIGAFSPQSSFGGNVFARGIETAIGFPGALAVPGHFARQGRNARLISEFEKLMEEIRAGGSVR